MAGAAARSARVGSRPGCRLSLCTHRDIRTIANILRVDHAGERGAIAIYQAQIWVARRSATDLQEFLATSIDDERRHLMVFEQLMRDRDIIPCRTLSFWGLGGFLLGFTTSLLGRDAILVCTEAVERTVHRHLVDQMDWLATRDVEIVTAITSIQAEELAHLQFAQGERKDLGDALGLRVLDTLVAASTEALIWVSTYGASSRMVAGIGSKRGR